MNDPEQAKEIEEVKKSADNSDDNEECQEVVISTHNSLENVESETKLPPIDKKLDLSCLPV